LFKSLSFKVLSAVRLEKQNRMHCLEQSVFYCKVDRKLCGKFLACLVYGFFWFISVCVNLCIF